jgi:hypothetical protein
MSRPGPHTCHRLLLLVPALFVLPPVRGDEPAERDAVLTECLVLRPVGRGGRAPVHTDALEAEVVAGRWKAPAAGDAVQGPSGRQTWTAATAKDGRLQHPALQGGYLYWNVTADAEGVRILEAAGHSLVYVNGQPRVGDPYSNGIVRVPVLLRKGSNDLLFLVGRGQLAAKLVKPGVSALLSTSDPTLPDYILGARAKLWGAVVVINASTRPLENAGLDVVVGGGEAVREPIPTIPPLSVRKAAFALPPHPDKMDKPTLELRLFSDRELAREPVSGATFAIAQKTAEELHKRTFVSAIDGSVQYYAVRRCS